VDMYSQKDQKLGQRNQKREHALLVELPNSDLRKYPRVLLMGKSK